jgi:uncharacterized protein YcgL (UPF0745 family)
MQCNIYQLADRPDVFLFLPVERTLDMLPVEVREKLGDLKLIKTISLSEDLSLIAVDTTKAIENIRKYGFHVQGATVSTSTLTSGVGAALGTGLRSNRFERDVPRITSCRPTSTNLEIPSPSGRRLG